MIWPFLIVFNFPLFRFTECILNVSFLCTIHSSSIQWWFPTHHLKILAIHFDWDDWFINIRPSFLKHFRVGTQERIYSSSSRLSILFWCVFSWDCFINIFSYSGFQFFCFQLGKLFGLFSRVGQGWNDLGIELRSAFSDWKIAFDFSVDFFEWFV